MRSRNLSLLLAAGLAVAARAQEAAPSAAAATNNAAAASGVLRDPFWPIGYQPAAEVSSHTAVPNPADGDEPRAGLQMNNLTPEQQAALSRKLKVSGILKSRNGYSAFLNGKLVETGDELTVDFNGQTLVLVVRSIAENSVQIEPKP